MVLILFKRQLYGPVRTFINTDKLILFLCTKNYSAHIFVMKHFLNDTHVANQARLKLQMMTILFLAEYPLTLCGNGINCCMTAILMLLMNRYIQWNILRFLHIQRFGFIWWMREDVMLLMAMSVFIWMCFHQNELYLKHQQRYFSLFLMWSTDYGSKQFYISSTKEVTFYNKCLLL